MVTWREIAEARIERLEGDFGIPGESQAIRK
jgi:hypothetical protein